MQTTLSSTQSSFRLPPWAARTAGPPRTRTRRCINRAKRTIQRGRAPPSGGRPQRITYGLWVLLPGSGGGRSASRACTPVDVVAEDPHRLQVVAWKVQCQCCPRLISGREEGGGVPI